MSDRRNEVWRDIPGFEGLYRVSTFGRVFMYKRTWRSGRWVDREIPDKELTYFIAVGGYVVVQLRSNGRQQPYKVHRLVALAFIPNPKNKPQVNHIDGDKNNNRLDNLEWVTSAENMRHASNNNLLNAPKGSDHGCVKLTEKDVIAIRESELMYKELAAKYSVHKGTIASIKNRKTWRHL